MYERPLLCMDTLRMNWECEPGLYSFPTALKLYSNAHCGVIQERMVTSLISLSFALHFSESSVSII